MSVLREEVDHYVFSEPKDGASIKQARNVRKSQQRSGASKASKPSKKSSPSPYEDQNLEGRDIKVEFNARVRSNTNAGSELRVEGSERSGSLQEPELV